MANCEHESGLKLSLKLIHTDDSPTPAGGVALYVSKALTSFPRSDVTLDLPLVESVWVEIATAKNKKPILVGCIYKHPGANNDEFNGKRDETMKLFNPNKYQLYILGDMNIDFFKCLPYHKFKKEWKSYLLTNQI